MQSLPVRRLATLDQGAGQGARQGWSDRRRSRCGDAGRHLDMGEKPRPRRWTKPGEWYPKTQAGAARPNARCRRTEAAWRRPARARETQPAAASALRLIALTGLRREEACGLRWREIDAAVQALRLEATKTGRSMRPIGKVALDLLAAVPRSSEFVFPSRDGTQSADLKKRDREHFRCSRVGRCTLSRPAPHVWQHGR